MGKGEKSGVRAHRLFRAIFRVW